MNKAECAKVLAKIQLGDNRQVDALVLEEWFDTIGFLDFESAISGVRLHRQESAAWIMPAHVIAGARRERETRLPPRHAIEQGECRHVFKGGWCVHCPTEEPNGRHVTG